jgi:transcriptional regulator with XRE-family HTH domain
MTEDLFDKNFNTMDEDKPPTNSISLSTMLEADDKGFIPTDKLDAVFTNPPPDERTCSGIKAPKPKTLRANISDEQETELEVKLSNEDKHILLSQTSNAGLDKSAPTTSTTTPKRVLPPADEVKKIKLKPNKVVKESSLKSVADKPVKIAGSISTENASVGQILQEARVSMDLALQEVEAKTRIKKSFLEAIEKDDMKTLPAMCYVSAYIKTLSQLYRIPADTTASLLASIKEKQNEQHVPSELLQSLEQDKHVNHGEEEKIKNITRLFMGTVALIVGGVLFYFYSPNDDSGVAAPQTQSDAANYFNSKELEVLIPHIDIDVTEIPDKNK